MLSFSVTLWAQEAKKASRVEADAGKTAILALDFAGQNTPYWNPKVIQEMRDGGFEVDMLRTPGKMTLDEKYVRRFNVVILMGVEPDFSHTLAPVLDRFMQDGGGVLVVPDLGDIDVTQHHPLLAFLRWLKGYGAEVNSRLIIDPTREKKGIFSSANWFSFAWTTDFAEHPVTRGMRCLWYCTLANKGRGYIATAPIELGKDWTALVKSGQESEAVSWEEIEKIEKDSTPSAAHNPSIFGEFLVKGRTKGAQPFVAVRDVGKGRMAVVAMEPRMLFWNAYSPYAKEGPGLEGGLILHNGIGDKPSDGWLMLSNMYRWLAEPSLKTDTLGSAKTALSHVLRTEEHGLPRTPGPTAWGSSADADEAGLGKPLGMNHDVPWGLMGAHTALSSGTGTVKDWADAAKVAGLDFIIFMDDFDKMGKQKWEQLKSECSAETGNGFVAYPGMEGQWQIGNHFFLAYRNLKWPSDPRWLTRDGKRIETANTFGLNGAQLFQCYSQQGYIANVGFFRHCENEVIQPTWDYEKYQWFSVYSRDRNGWIDNHLNDYLAVQQQNNYECPVGISLMHEPSEITKAVRERWPFMTVLGAKKGDAEAIIRGIDQSGGYGYCNRSGTLCASTGPRVLSWAVTATCSYDFDRWNTAQREDDYYVLNNYRYRVRLAVKDDEGIEEIVIHDGIKGAYRRFLPQGAKTFEATLDLENDQYRHLVAVVKNCKGGIAVTPELKTDNWANRLYWCSDRNNIYSAPRGHTSKWGMNQRRPGPYTRQNGPDDTLLGEWRFPIVSLDHREERMIFRRSLEKGHHPSAETDMWNQLYRSDPMDEMEMEIAWHYWRAEFGGPIYFWEEYGVELDGSSGKADMPKEPFYEECRWTQPPERGLPKWTLPGNVSNPTAYLNIEKRVKLLKDVEYVKPWIEAFTLTSLGGASHLPQFIGAQYAPGEQYEFRLGDKIVKGTLPAKGAPEVKEEGLTVNGGVFALDCTNVMANVIYVGGKDLHYKFSAKDGLCTLQVGWPVTTENSRKGAEFRHETYSLKTDGLIAAGIDGLMKAPGISVETGARRAGVLPYTFEPYEGALVLRFGDVRTPEEWVHCVVEGLNPHWPVYYREIGKMRRIRPVGVDPDGKAYVTIWRDKKDVSVFIGHPIVCSDAEICFDAVRHGDGKWILEINNPTDKSKTVSFSWNKDWPGTGELPQNMMIAAGGRVNVSLKEATTVEETREKNLNVLSNADFEKGTYLRVREDGASPWKDLIKRGVKVVQGDKVEMPSDWTPNPSVGWSDGNCTYRYVSGTPGKEVHSGKHAVYIASKAESDLYTGGASIVSNWSVAGDREKYIARDKPIKFSFWAKGNAMVKIDGYYGAWSKIPNAFRLTDEWRNYEGELTASPNAKTVSFVLRVSGGEATIDDVALWNAE